ncbi:MAG: hypothetical protein U0414_06450 [Polyangiaceae bacterium]
MRFYLAPLVMLTSACSMAPPSNACPPVPSPSAPIVQPWAALVAPPSNPPPPLSPRQHLRGAVPPPAEATAIEYAALPLMADESQCSGTDAGTGTARSCANDRFTLSRRSVHETCSRIGQLIHYDTWSLTGLDAHSRVWIEGAPVLSLDRLIAGTYEDSVGQFEALSSRAPASADWMTVQIPPGESMRIARCAGVFDGGALTARAVWKQSVQAKAILPRRVFVFRACEEGCDRPLDDPRRVEVIRLLAPRAQWVGTGGDAKEAVIPRGQSFTLLETHVRPGASSMLEVVYDRESAASFGALSDPQAEPELTSFTLDIVWPEGQAPTATAYRAIPTVGVVRPPVRADAPSACDREISKRAPKS